MHPGAPAALTLEQLQSITDAVPALVCYIDPTCRYQMCNHAYAEWCGATPATLQGQRVAETLGAEAWQAVGPRVEAALRGQPQVFEILLRDRHGCPRWFDAVYTPQRDAQGGLLGVVVMATDITTRKQAELDLRESEARFRAVVSQVTVGIAQVDLSGRFRLVNQRYCQMLGYTEAELLERRMQDVTHPDDLSANLAPFKALAEGGPDFVIEKRYLAKDGSPVWVHNSVAAVRDGEGRLTGIVAVVLDVTERRRAEQAVRESEARFRNMSNHAPMMLWVTDATGACTHLNERWLEFTGQALQNALGYGWLEAVHPEDRPEAQGVFASSNARQIAFRLEYRLRRYDGSYHWAIDAASPRFAERGEFLGFIGSVIDIQERKEAENALRAAKEQAEQALRAKDSFLAQLSHELRTPLAPVLMTAAALREDETLPAAAREQLGMIERNVALEARLIDDLLDLTRITHGRLELRTEPADLHLLLELVVEIIQDEAREKQIQVDLDLGASRRRLVADPARLQQVFWNLLRNAVKFTPAGGHICIRTRDADILPELAPSGVSVARGEGPAMAGGVGIEVMDDGIGFRSEEADQIFEPFRRGGGSQQMSTAGLGLGLSIARAIVQLHGGEMEARSGGPGCGATFRVRLPNAETMEDAAPGAAPRVAMALEADRSLRLLLVEDHAPTLQVLARLLERDGHRITAVGTRAAALEVAAEQTFDAVLSDLGLPDGTGLELMEQLRERHGLRGIALSGYGMAEDVERSAAAGFVAHLTKPVSLNDVRRVLRSCLGEPA